jgi:membrane-bound ClpP family serine protease
MCHLILMLPLLALVAFWIWPIWIAGPFYAVVILASGFMYFFLMRAMRLPVQTGVEGLMHSTGQVIDANNGIFFIQMHSEIWNAHSPDELHTGDTVKIVGLKGLSLDVQKIPEMSH